MAGTLRNPPLGTGFDVDAAAATRSLKIREISRDNTKDNLDKVVAKEAVNLIDSSEITYDYDNVDNEHTKNNDIIEDR